jgi:IMP cyclohydrolase
MTISITSITQVAHKDELERDILRFETVVNIDGNDYVLDVYLNRDNDDAVEFDYPEDLDLSDEDQDDIFMEVVQAILASSTCD